MKSTQKRRLALADRCAAAKAKLPTAHFATKASTRIREPAFITTISVTTTQTACASVKTLTTKCTGPMLSEKTKAFLEARGTYDGSDDAAYRGALEGLAISQDTAFAEFNLHTTDVTFSGRKYEVYNVCWFILNSNYYLDLKASWEKLKIPGEYIPLDSFEAGGGFFYNRKTGAVVELELGENLKSFLSGKLEPQWQSFNDFLEWYFELE